MKIAKLEYTKQGYSYMQVTREDCFCWGGMSICDSCGKDMNEEIYLIFVLGQAFCKECFEKWKNRAKICEDDLYLQEQNQERWYMAHEFRI